MTIRTSGVAILTLAVALPLARPAYAAELTLSDIATCNEEAAMRSGGAALPGPKRPPAETRGQSPIVEGERDLPKRAGGERSDPSGSIVTETPDPLAKGMDAQRANDPAYRAAYRDCLQARLSRGR